MGFTLTPRTSTFSGERVICRCKNCGYIITAPPKLKRQTIVTGLCWRCGAAKVVEDKPRRRF